MTTHHTTLHRTVHLLLLAAALLVFGGCADQWKYVALKDVQTQLPGLMDRQWSRRREYTHSEMLAVQPGGAQTILVARYTKPGTEADVAQRDEDVSRTFVMILDSPVKPGTYHITPDNGRVIESTMSRPAWRPYRGIEGDVTILSVSDGSIKAAVRLTSLILHQSDPEHKLRGIHTFKTVTGGEPVLQEAQINVSGMMPATAPGE